MTKINLLIAALLLCAPARAIELSLEENRAERGSVGFVDIQRLFSASPDAARAKESFEELVRQAEERVNLKKAEGLKIRLEMEGLKTERDTLALSTPALPSPVAPPPPAPEPAKAPEPEKAPAKALTLPGMTPLASEPSIPAAIEVSTPTAQAPVAVSTPPVQASDPSQPPTAPELSRRLMELDGRIAGLLTDLGRKEEELRREQQDADKGLLDVEGRKTDQVLARLYRAINEVARKEGVSVVVDKTTILYGHPAVDLTDKVLKHLKGSAQP